MTCQSYLSHILRVNTCWGQCFIVVFWKIYANETWVDSVKCIFHTTLWTILSQFTFTPCVMDGVKVNWDQPVFVPVCIKVLKEHLRLISSFDARSTNVKQQVFSWHSSSGDPWINIVVSPCKIMTMMP